ncbi:hypothetical protein [Candidatus Odyssella thessalonicensis]|uniref:hypothetical protein n=1 Tax=Candidatus Odyssella thessalonicensis TaxID=84647 RepID=UPI0002DDE7EB|nr:hypothetical protein [Candidatus Odyssella thessalonicensis]
MNSQTQPGKHVLPGEKPDYHSLKLKCERRLKKPLAKLPLLSFCALMLLITLSTSAVCNSSANSSATPSSSSDNPAPEITEAMVMEALSASKKQAPWVHADALKVWGNFQSGSIEPNYSYYFWARKLIIWLQKNYNIRFNSYERVSAVFSALSRNKLISEDAENVLTRFVWQNLQRWENLAPEEKAMPQYRHENETIFIENLNEVDRSKPGQQDKK